MVTSWGDPAFISIELVKDTLNELHDSSKPMRPNPLDQMVLVEQRMLDRSMPRTSHARTFALYEVLIHLIETEFAAVRSAYKLPLPDRSWNIDDYRAGVIQDARLKQIEYSLLYHVFTRPELNLSLSTFAEWISVGMRTAERYRDVALQRFTYTLIAAEREVRRTDRQRALLNRLPSSRGRIFVGHDALLERCEGLLTHSHPAHLLIAGQAGTGKSAFAEALIRRWVNDGRISDVIWIDRPQTTASIRELLSAYLIPEGMQVELRDVLSRAPQPIVIVCDGCERLLEREAEAVDSLLLEGDSALYLLTSRRYEALEHIKTAIEIPRLTFADSYKLLQQTWDGTTDDPITLEDAQILYEHLEGSPDAIMTAARRLRVETWGQVQRAITINTYGDIWNAATLPVRQMWVVAAVSGIAFDLVLESLANSINGNSDETCAELRRWSVMEHGSRRLTNGAQHFIETECQIQGTVKDTVKQVIALIESTTMRLTSSLYRVIETLLIHQWLPLDDQQRQLWIQAGMSEGVLRGQPALWMKWLRQLPLSVQSFETQRFIGIVLRRLGHWEEAGKILNDVITQSGHKGMFSEQTLSMVELSVIERYNGKYDRALNLVERAAAAALKYAPELISRLALERSRILLDRGESAQALAALSTLEESPDVLMLKCEAYLTSGFFGECIRLAEHLIQFDLTDAQSAALHTLIGRSYEGDGNYQTAQPYFSTSLAIAERSGDPLAIARARGNFGAGLYHLGYDAEAKTALDNAAIELRRLGDKVGLAVALHNSQLVEIRLAR